MSEDQKQYEIKVGQHGKNCECSKCQPVKTTFCECETCQSHREGKQESMRDRLKRFLEEAKGQDGELRCEDGSVYQGKAWQPKVSGESVKEFNRDQEGMPCDFCSHHVRAEPSFCVTCDPENSNYAGYGFEVDDSGDLVNHPAHYTRAPVETIDIIKDVLTRAYGPDGYRAYCLGSEIKYRMRAGLKGDPVQDIEKAMKYMEFREAEK